MATRSAASLPLKKKFGSFQQRSSNSNTTSSKQSIGVAIRNMARAAAVIAIKRAVAIASLHLTDNADSNVYDRPVKFCLLTLSGGKLKTKHQSPFFKVEDFYSSDSSASSPRKAGLPQYEAQSSPIVIMHAMIIGAVNFEEEFTSLKATLERLSKESTKKDARIKRQEEHIAKLLKKLDKGPRVLSNKGASSDEDEKGSNRSKASEDDGGSKKACKSQNDSSLSVMTAE